MQHIPLREYLPAWPAGLGITPARPLPALDVDGAHIAELEPGLGGRALVEPITDFKRELDRRLVFAAGRDAPPDPWLLDRGFIKEPSGKGVCGRNLLRWLFGPFVLDDQVGGELCRVPAWMCIGWNRYQRPPLPRQEGLEVAEWLDQHTRTKDREQAIGFWVEPFPLVVMSEGQNRIDLFHALDQPVLVRLRRARMVSPSLLQMQRVVGCDDMVALSWRPRNWWRARGANTALLPFPALSVPALEAYGVRWSRVPYVLTPQAAALRGAGEHPWNHPTTGVHRWRPSSWRPMLLSQGYV